MPQITSSTVISTPRTPGQARKPGLGALVFALLIVGVLGSAHVARAASVCDRMSGWLAAEDNAVSPTYSLKNRAAWGNHAQVEKHRVAGELFNELLLGKLPAEELDSCIAHRTDRQNLVNFLQSQFLQKGVERLDRSLAPVIQIFRKLLDERYGSPDRIFFRMTGHFREETPSEFKAGYHRASRSIYMDWGRVPANEWLIILVHELLHSLDTRIWDGLELAGTPVNVRRVQKLVKKFTAPHALNPTDSEFMSQWVSAGLDRGLWAEYRAWLATLAIYEAGLTDGLWVPIDWLDRIVQECPADFKRELCFYKFIDARSPDPMSGLLGTSLVLGQIRQVRATQRDWLAPLPLGPLEALVR